MTLNVWMTVLTEYRLKEHITTLNGMHRTDFTPNKLENRFKEWTVEGMTALCNIMKEGTLLSFDMFKKKILLKKQDSYRYLQMWNYVNKYVKIITV